MPVAQSRRLGTALWTATVVLLVPLVITLTELGSGSLRPWIRLIALIVVGITLLLLLSQHRELQRRIREWERVQASLRASEAKFSGILSIAADAIITVDQAQRIVHFNHGAEYIFGYQADDVMGHSLGMLLPARYRGGHERHMTGFALGPDEARRMGERREIFGLRADGTEFPAEASISKLDTPEGMLFTVVLRDITARKRAEESERFMAEAAAALARSLDLDEALQRIADLPVPRLADAAIVDVLASGDAVRRVVSTVQREDLTPAVRQLGASPPSADSPSPIVDVIRRGRAEFVPTVDAEWLEAYEERDAAAAWAALGARALEILPLVAGDQVLGALTLVAVDPARTFGPEAVALATKFASAAATAIDNARLYRVAQRATRARDEVLSVVSHDMRNPLSAITMCARALDERASDDAAARRDLVSTIRESAVWIERLIQDLLDVANIEQGRLSLETRPVDPVQLVLQARHMFEMEATEHHLTFIQEVPTNLPYVRADSARVVQVLGNLLRNAVKFTPDGGTISVGLESRMLASAAAAAAASGATSGGRELVFFVRDTGVGIPPEKQARVFDRYWQSSDGARVRGTGLGLSIAKGIVEAHGGRLWVESAAGAGATFRFSLPVADGD